jgi:hypothetical protein
MMSCLDYSTKKTEWSWKSMVSTGTDGKPPRQLLLVADYLFIRMRLQQIQSDFLEAALLNQASTSAAYSGCWIG